MSTTTPAIATVPYDELQSVLRGELITPADPRYDEARAVYNAMIDKRPAAVARCRDAADVVACVRFARAHDLTIAVRARHRPVADAQRHRRPRGRHRPRRRRLHVG